MRQLLCYDKITFLDRYSSGFSFAFTLESISLFWSSISELWFHQMHMWMCGYSETCSTSSALRVNDCNDKKNQLLHGDCQPLNHLIGWTVPAALILFDPGCQCVIIIAIMKRIEILSPQVKATQNPLLEWHWDGWRSRFYHASIWMSSSLVSTSISCVRRNLFPLNACYYFFYWNQLLLPSFCA